MFWKQSPRGVVIKYFSPSDAYLENFFLLGLLALRQQQTETILNIFLC